MEKKKRVYVFGKKSAEGAANLKDLLGGKGANLAEMDLLGYQYLQVLLFLLRHVQNITLWVKINYLKY